MGGYINSVLIDMGLDMIKNGVYMSLAIAIFFNISYSFKK